MDPLVHVAELLFEAGRGVLEEYPVYLFLGRPMCLKRRQVQLLQGQRERLFPKQEEQSPEQVPASGVGA